MSFENRLQTGKHSYLVSGFGCDSDPYFYTFLLISCTFHRAISNIHWHLQPHLRRCRVLTTSIESNGTCGNSVSLKIRPLILKM